MTNNEIHNTSGINESPKSDNFDDAPKFLTKKIKEPFGPGYWVWVEEEEIINLGMTPSKTFNVAREACMIKVCKGGEYKTLPGCEEAIIPDHIPNLEFEDKVEEEPQECQYCGDIMENPSALSNHTMGHFPLKQKIALSNTAPFNCPFCQLSHEDKIAMLNHLSKEHTSIYEYHTDDYVCARIIDKNQNGVPEPEDDDDEKDDIGDFEEEAMEFLKKRGLRDGNSKSKRRKFQIGPGKWAWMKNNKIQGSASPPSGSDDFLSGDDSDDFNIKYEQEDNVRQVKRRQCTFCNAKFEELQDLRNHTLNHFKKQLLSHLPNQEPYKCPTCNETMSDSIMLIQHYAFTHQMIYEYCTEDDLIGRPIGKGNQSPKSSDSNDSKNASKGFTGIRKPMKVSKDLAAIIETDISSRTKCVKKLWVYIKSNKLQDPRDGRYVFPDEKMAIVFGSDRLRGFSLTKYLGKHLTPLDEEEQGKLNQQLQDKDYVWQCSFCDENYKNRKNLTLHTVGHFEPQLMAHLPSEPPLTCPKCQALQRDKITLLRHYALGHRTIFDFCSKENLGGRRVVKEVDKQNRNNDQGSSSDGESSAGSDSGSESHAGSLPSIEDKNTSGRSMPNMSENMFNSDQQSAEGVINNKEH